MAIDGAMSATETPTADQTLRVRRNVVWRGRALFGQLITLVENQRFFRAGGHAITGALFVSGRNVMLLERRVAHVVDGGEQLGISGVAERMAHAS